MQEIFVDFNVDNFYKIINNNDIIYNNLYDLDYDKIIFLSYDKDLINKLKINGLHLEFISNELKNNFDIVKIACINNGNALQYASNEFKNNRDIV